MSNTPPTPGERDVAEKLVDGLLAAGYELNIDNGGDGFELGAWSRNRDEVLGTMFATWEEEIIARKDGKKAVVMMVYGNAEDGSEVAADYTTSLDPIVSAAMKDASERADRRAAAEYQAPRPRGPKP